MNTKVQRTDDDGFVGFTSVAEVDFAVGGYEWSVLGVWSRDSDGTLWWASDSGCSCNSAWDTTSLVWRLFSIAPLRAARVEEEISPEKWAEFLGAVEAALDKLRRV